MNKHLWICGAFVMLVLAGFASKANANITLAATYKDTPESTDHIVSVASSTLGLSGLTNLLRLEDTSQPEAGSPFTIDYLSDSTAQVSWNLAGTGSVLNAIYIFGGSNGANLYEVTDAAQMISGSAIIHTPVTGNSGQFAGISHTLFLGSPVPEPASTLLVTIGILGLLYRRIAGRR